MRAGSRNQNIYEKFLRIIMKNKYLSILIVEDEAGMVSLLKDIINDGARERNIPICIESASTVREAARIMDEFGGFDCIFMDGALVSGAKQPDTVGLVMITLDKFPNSHIVAHSGRDDFNEMLLAAGCHDAILKSAHDMEGYMKAVGQNIATIAAFRETANAS